MTPYRKAPFQNTFIPQPVKIFSTFLLNGRLIILITTATHLSPPWDTPIQSAFSSYLLLTHFNVILPSVPRFSKWSLAVMFTHQTLYAPFISHIRAIYPDHLILLDFNIRLWKLLIIHQWRSQFINNTFCGDLNKQHVSVVKQNDQQVSYFRSYAVFSSSILICPPYVH